MNIINTAHYFLHHLIWGGFFFLCAVPTMLCLCNTIFTTFADPLLPAAPLTATCFPTSAMCQDGVNVTKPCGEPGLTRVYHKSVCKCVLYYTKIYGRTGARKGRCEWTVKLLFKQCKCVHICNRLFT